MSSKHLQTTRDVVGGILSSSTAKDSFDTLISTKVLEHVREPWVMASEIGRVLKSGGIVIGSTPYYFRYPNVYVVARQK